MCRRTLPCISCGVSTSTQTIKVPEPVLVLCELCAFWWKLRMSGDALLQVGASTDERHMCNRHDAQVPGEEGSSLRVQASTRSPANGPCPALSPLWHLHHCYLPSSHDMCTRREVEHYKYGEQTSMGRRDRRSGQQTGTLTKADDGVQVPPGSASMVMILYTNLC